MIERLKAKQSLLKCVCGGATVEKGKCADCLKREQESRLPEAILGNLCGVPKIYLPAEPAADKTFRSLYLFGDCGVGKTYKAVAIMKAYLNSIGDDDNRRKYPIFISAPELFLKIRSVFSRNRSEEELVDRYGDCAFLVLDDLGAEKTSEWTTQTLYTILSRRGDNDRVTIITSNLSLDTVGKVVGERIASRIAGMCKVVCMQGHDKRVDKRVVQTGL